MTAGNGIVFLEPRSRFAFVVCTQPQWPRPVLARQALARSALARAALTRPALARPTLATSSWLPRPRPHCRPHPGGLRVDKVCLHFRKRLEIKLEQIDH